MSEISLLINSTKYSGWKQASIDISIENLSATFQLSLTDRWSNDSAPVVIKPTDACELKIDNQTLITGYIDIVNLNVDASNHGITIAGRDKTSDIIDCSIINGTGQYKNLTLTEIVSRICEPFNIEVQAEVDTGEPFPTFNVEQGSTALESIQKLCAARQCLAISDGGGGLIITRAGTEKIETNLLEGVNILSGIASYDYTLRYNKYIVKGQQQGNDNLDVDSISGNSATVTDSGVVRYRPLVVVADGQSSRNDCSTRANWELNTRKGRSRRFTITVVGWQQPNGELWTINKLVFINSRYLGVYDNLLICAINFSIDSNDGQITTLTLTSPDAYLTIQTESIDIDLNPYILEGDE